MADVILYRGIIASVNDPQMQGRALVIVPTLQDSPSWAKVYLAPLSCSTSPPALDDIVLVGFEGGSVRFPVVFPLACGELVSGIKLLRGLVTQTVDPSGAGRVGVEIPALWSSGVTPWATPCRMLHRAPAGTLPVDTRVLVAHENGDLLRPVVLGLI